MLLAKESARQLRPAALNLVTIQTLVKQTELNSLPGIDVRRVLLDFSLTVKAATLIFISGCGSAISSAKEGKSGFIFNLVKSK